MKAKLVRGQDLTENQKAEVLAAFIYRHKHSMAKQTDDQWLASHAFYIRRDGHLAVVPRYCESIG